MAVGSAVVDPLNPEVLSAFVVRMDPWGEAGCGQAGRCIGKAAADCDDGNPCTADRCVPENGECENLTLPDTTPCGASHTCTAGVCQ